jgi:hypothetical protein
VGEQQERTLAAVALKARDQISAGRVQREGAGGDAFGFEDFVQIVDDLGFVAGRVGGIDADER